jgi:AraC family transcriptional regulator, transcriptional activator of the genes for pyochelin and ferripyochelin receptors
LNAGISPISGYPSILHDKKKVARGFREVYRTTVFGYVRMLRMEKAWMMFETGEMNVSEVALDTGYTSFGHFAAAFRERFGITPRDFKNGRRS